MYNNFQFSSLSLHDGGYDYKFIEEPADSLKCLICLLVVREPQQHGGCGKLFCKSCITIKYKTLRNDCPHCRQPLKISNGIPTIFNDFRSDQEVKSLMIYCSTACGWKGELGSLNHHKQKDCKNTVVSCRNGCGAMNVSRKNLQAHLESECPNRLHKCPDCGANNQYKNHQVHTKLHCSKRSYSCVHCGQKGCFDERTSTHLEVCPKMKIPCKKCLESIMRCQLTAHLEVCKFQPVLCKYAQVGCKVRPLRKYLKKHEEDLQLHLQVTTDKVLELTRILPKPVTPVTFRVTDFDKRKTDNDVIYSPSFYTSKNGYEMCLRIFANGSDTGKGTHVSVFTCLLLGEYDDYLTWPFTGTFTIEILNQENHNHHQLAFTIPADEFSDRVLYSERRGRGYPEFISHTDLAKQSQCQYLKDDTLIFRVSVVNIPDYKQHLECIN